MLLLFLILITLGVVCQTGFANLNAFSMTRNMTYRCDATASKTFIFVNEALLRSVRDIF